MDLVAADQLITVDLYVVGIVAQPRGMGLVAADQLISGYLYVVGIVA
jgi:hypothetical protein